MGEDYTKWTKVRKTFQELRDQILFVYSSKCRESIEKYFQSVYPGFSKNFLHGSLQWKIQITSKSRPLTFRLNP